MIRILQLQKATGSFVAAKLILLPHYCVPLLLLFGWLVGFLLLFWGGCLFSDGGCFSVLLLFFICKSEANFSLKSLHLQQQICLILLSLRFDNTEFVAAVLKFCPRLSTLHPLRYSHTSLPPVSWTARTQPLRYCDDGGSLGEWSSWRH